MRAEKLDRSLATLMVILLLGAVPPLLDSTIVNVAVDAIGRDLHTTVSAIQWVITSYLLSFGMVIPLSGWALARFGGRSTWIFSLVVFLAGSVLSGAAWNVGALIGFRVLQGAGGGLLIPLLTTLIMQAADGRQLGRLMAALSLPVAVVSILGPVLSGLIISHVSWRWAFFVNVPACLVAIAVAWRGLQPARQDAGAAAGRLDVAGLLLLCPALAGLLYGLGQVSSAGGFGRLQVLVPLLAGAVLLAGFAVHALRTGGEPLVDLRLFRSRAFTGTSALMFLAGLSIYGAMLLVPLYLQQARGYSALAAGLLLVPQGVGSVLPRTIVGRLTDRMGPRPVTVAGLVLAGVGTIPFALAGSHPGTWFLCAGLVVRGAGLGAATIALMAGAFQGLPKADVPHASIATRIMQQLGGAFGAAILVVILAGQAGGRLGSQGALTTAFGHTFWWCIGFTALAVVPGLLMPGRPAPVAAEPAGPGPAAAQPGSAVSIPS
jgi:EmrB/QacA subfamily drug resistance transporter